MPFPLMIALLVCLGFFLVPVWLLRRRSYARGQDYFVSSDRTPPGVIANASIAGTLRVAAIGPLFAWGAGGDFWPVIIAAVMLGLGVALLIRLRRPMLTFLDAALDNDRAVTLHEFFARQHVGDR